MTPITPVPLLCASMITGVVLYLPSVIATIFLAHQLYGMAMPGALISLLLFCLPRRDRLSVARSDHRRGRQFLTGKQHSHSADLHDDAVPERRDNSALLVPHWLQNITQFIPATVSHDRDRRDSATGRIVRRELGVGARFAPHHCGLALSSRPSSFAGRRRKSSGPRPNFGSCLFSCRSSLSAPIRPGVSTTL